ncbi:hypothetical protein G7072_18845 [Nocardioides sp. HDW12B]|uniref:ATP-binding protein n=1 Tax=Nocardioides sp. HDW12B TaxID=2714939 RepID=UPI00140D3541|nr:ATP-binding protein [Nocardioides sp. HDW12B]QIK68120.1 hypothetical protein G7072_18845 [Nocardioides sp. HDW12B]
MGSRRGVGTVVSSMVFAAVYAAAMELGLSLPIDGASLAVIWPACGVAAVWLLCRQERFPVLDLALLAVVTFVVNDAVGVGVPMSVTFTVVNLVQALLVVHLLRRLAPDLWGCGGQGTFDRLHTLFVGVAASAVSSAVAACIAAAGFTAFVAPPTWLNMTVHWGRNSFGMLIVLTTAHLVAHALRGDGRRTLPAAFRARAGELGGLVVVSVAVYVGVFGQLDLPLAFLPLMVTLWAGLRFSSSVVALHGLTASVVALAATLAGTGPLAGVSDDAARALLVQLLMSIFVVSGLSLAASRHEAGLLLEQARTGQRAATEQAAVLSTVIDAMSQGLVVLDRRGRVVRANHVGRGVIAAPSFVLAGSEPYGEEFTWEQVAEIIVCERTPCAFDLRVDGGAGARTVVHVRSTPLPVSSDDPEAGEEATVVVLDDVTADRAAREELQTFASSVAHDLRTPLTAVKGWAVQLRSLGEDGPVERDTATAMLDRVVDNADRMNDLIADLLDHATTQGGELQTRLASVSRLANRVAEQVGVRGVTTVERTPLVLCDKALVAQLLTNLLQNAVKYVDDGVTARVHLAARTEGDHVRFCLTDNGAGIHPAERERVFERFYRGSTSQPGTGLGLFICRTIVERHGGTIHVEEGPGGVGSSFVFTLPAAVARTADATRSAGISA